MRVKLFPYHMRIVYSHLSYRRLERGGHDRNLFDFNGVSGIQRAG